VAPGRERRGGVKGKGGEGVGGVGAWQDRQGWYSSKIL